MTAPIYCDWEKSRSKAAGFECRRCGRYSYDSQKMKCREENPDVRDWRDPEPEPAAEAAKAPVMLGDKVEAWLTKHGITQESYGEIKAKFGLPSNCNCSSRKRWLNEVGQYFGIGVDSAD